MVIFQIDLFSAKGPVPQNLFEIAQREKEIRYSSRTRLNTDIFCELQAIRRAVRHLRPTLSEPLASNADWQLLDRLSCDAAITIVQLIHRRAAYWTQSNDYEFSRFTMEEHWTSGRADVERTLNHPEWKSRTRPEEGVKVLDLTRDLDTQARRARENRRRQSPRLRHAGDESGLSAGPYRSSTANISSSPTAPTGRRWKEWCRSRSLSTSRSSNTNSSACRTQPASAITRSQARSSR
jgi:hypothetical protein